MGENSPYIPCNRHQQLRRELWNAVYVEALKHNSLFSDAESHADKALKAFDKRFKHP